jgi:hypothetical protein
MWPLRSAKLDNGHKTTTTKHTRDITCLNHTLHGYIPYLHMYKLQLDFFGEDFEINNNAALDFTCVKVKYLRLHLQHFGCC